MWLDVACLLPTRSQAKAACEGGKIEVNGVRGKPHREVGPGDRLTITMRSGDRREVVIRAVAERSIPKAEARKLYEDITPPPSPELLEARRLDRMMRIEPASRPSARQRRELRKWKGRE